MTLVAKKGGKAPPFCSLTGSAPSGWPSSYMCRQTM